MKGHYVSCHYDAFNLGKTIGAPCLEGSFDKLCDELDKERGPFNTLAESVINDGPDLQETHALTCAVESMGPYQKVEMMTSTMVDTLWTFSKCPVASLYIAGVVPKIEYAKHSETIDILMSKAVHRLCKQFTSKKH